MSKIKILYTETTKDKTEEKKVELSLKPENPQIFTIKREMSVSLSLILLLLFSFLLPSSFFHLPSFTLILVLVSLRAKITGVPPYMQRIKVNGGEAKLSLSLLSFLQYSDLVVGRLFSSATGVDDIKLPPTLKMVRRPQRGPVLA
jgi:hypothetical protein